MRLHVLLFPLVCASATLAAQSFDFYARGPYRPTVPRPEAVTGYAAGEQETMYAVMQRYLDTLLASAPGRVRAGSIFRATLDRTHWLTLGHEQEQLPVYLDGTTFWRQSNNGANPVVFTEDSLTLSGFSWPGNTDRLLKGTAWAVVENQGVGRVVLFLSDPLFRGFWRGTARLVTNAILIGPNRR